MYYARLMGIAHCIVPQVLPLPADPQSSLVQSSSMELLASIMVPNQQHQLGGNQMPSIVQIIVPASLPHGQSEKLNETEKITTTTTTILPETFDNASNDTILLPQQIETSSTVEPLRSSILSTQHSTTTLEPEKEEESDDIDIDIVGDDYSDSNDKKQRNRSNFRYVESFESEKSIAQKFDPDPIENDSELKNVINENYQQIPSVLPVPKALSSSKDTENEDHEPPEELQDPNISAPEDN
jgi:hypothetical protein